MNKKPVILIGIVAYDGLDGQVALDYMRLVYHLGRRCPEYDFQLAIKSKSEQFRARNAIVRAGIQYGADYIWMLDDDHIIDISNSQQMNSAYDLPIKLVKHLEDNPKIGIVGALYYQRGGDYYPVIMQETGGEGDDPKPFFLTQTELSGRMQKVDVTGGGCMMIRTSVFDKVDEPYFAPEHLWGTDIQLCKQVRRAGWEVWCDTSLEVGHLRSDQEMLTGASIREMNSNEVFKPYVRYKNDVMDYLGMDMDDISDLSSKYRPSMSDMDKYDDIKDYYASRDNSQLARQYMFHTYPTVMNEWKVFQSMINTDRDSYGLDYGCGSAPIGFEFALLGHKIDFVDIDGCGSYEFTKWRAKKREIDCGWKLNGPYDYVLMMDVIEHLENPIDVLGDIVGRLNPGAVIMTNYFVTHDDTNPEHISLNHDEVREFFLSNGMVRGNDYLWVKDPDQMEKERAA